MPWSEGYLPHPGAPNIIHVAGDLEPQGYATTADPACLAPLRRAPGNAPPLQPFPLQRSSAATAGTFKVLGHHFQSPKGAPTCQAARLFRLVGSKLKIPPAKGPQKGQPCCPGLQPWSASLLALLPQRAGPGVTSPAPLVVRQVLLAWDCLSKLC